MKRGKLSCFQLPFSSSVYLDKCHFTTWNGKRKYFFSSDLGSPFISIASFRALIFHPVVTSLHWTSCMPWRHQWRCVRSLIKTGSATCRTSWRTEIRKEVWCEHRTMQYNLPVISSRYLTVLYVKLSNHLYDSLSGLEELHSLVEQAETKAFPQTNLLDQLRVVTSEADKVAVMAQQLLIGKRQTRCKKRRDLILSQPRIKFWLVSWPLYELTFFIVCYLDIVLEEETRKTRTSWLWRSWGLSSSSSRVCHAASDRLLYWRWENQITHLSMNISTPPQDQKYCSI